MNPLELEAERIAKKHTPAGRMHGMLAHDISQSSHRTVRDSFDVAQAAADEVELEYTSMARKYVHNNEHLVELAKVAHRISVRIGELRDEALRRPTLKG